MLSIKEILTESWRGNINNYLGGNGFDTFRDIVNTFVENGFRISNYQSDIDLLYTFILNSPKNSNVLTPAFDIEDSNGKEHILKIFMDSGKFKIVIVTKKDGKFSSAFLNKLKRVLTDKKFTLDEATFNCVRGYLTLFDGDSPTPVLGTQGVFLAR